MTTTSANWDKLTERFGSARDRSSSVGEAVQEHADQATRTWLYSAIVWLTIVDLFGLILALELISPNLFEGIPYLLFSRIRPLHVNGVIFAWLSMMYWGALFYFVPRLTGLRSMWSEKLAIWTAWGWNIWFVLGIITILTGHTQGREYAEFIWPLDIALLILWISNIFNILMTVANRRVRPLYVTTWWAMASPLWLGADYFIGNVVWRPGSIWGTGVSGALPTSMADGILNWWYAHNLFGLWLTPMLLAGLYYLVPRITKTSSLQPYVKFDFILGDGIFLYRCWAPPFITNAEPWLVEIHSYSVQYEPIDPGICIYGEHTDDDARTLGEILHQFAAAIWLNRLYFLLLSQCSGEFSGDSKFQPAYPFHEFCCRSCSSGSVGGVYFPGNGYYRLHHPTGS